MAWLEKLNKKGGEGWELVSEKFASGGTNASDSWAEFRGTMKRPL